LNNELFFDISVAVRVDVMGTVIGHASISQEMALEAVRKLVRDGCDVRFWTATPEVLSPELLDRLQEVAPVELKPLRPPPCRGWIVVDDEPLLRRVYARLGAIAVDMAYLTRMVLDGVDVNTKMAHDGGRQREDDHHGGEYHTLFPEPARSTGAGAGSDSGRRSGS
jgi:hypothetical protein